MFRKTMWGGPHDGLRVTVMDAAIRLVDPGEVKVAVPGIPDAHALMKKTSLYVLNHESGRYEYVLPMGQA